MKHPSKITHQAIQSTQTQGDAYLDHLQMLESESLDIIREVIAEFHQPVLLYSIGKDSSVLVRLLQKALFPGPVTIPLLHVDTGFKFEEMISFRDHFCKQEGLQLIVHQNEEAIAAGVHPETVGRSNCCAQLKTKALLDALTQGRFDAAICGARRDEEVSRAKERIFSFRNQRGQWQPKQQRPELWNLYNTRRNKGETIRVFPLSNWTERDIWTYIQRENIALPNLYFAKYRSVSERDGYLFLQPKKEELQPVQPTSDASILCRFRSLGCLPCSGAIRSTASNLEQIVSEMNETRRPERADRAIDHEEIGAMETKKREGYF